MNIRFVKTQKITALPKPWDNGEHLQPNTPRNGAWLVNEIQAFKVNSKFDPVSPGVFLVWESKNYLENLQITLTWIQHAHTYYISIVRLHEKLRFFLLSWEKIDILSPNPPSPSLFFLKRNSFFQKKILKKLWQNGG